LVSADKGYTPLNLSDNIISDIVKPNIPDTIANIKQKSLHGRYFKELEQPEINIQASHAWLKKSNIHSNTGGFIQGGPDITCQKNSGPLEGSNKSKKPLFVRSKIMGIN
jgi:hypothetical protein